jgi:hypothetical protein
MYVVGYNEIIILAKNIFNTLFSNTTTLNS